MKQFGFETNIERRSPFTGNVFMIDRMTSDWAEAHPLDVDGYIEQVYQKYQTMAQENPQLAVWAVSREQLRKMWDDVLGDINPRGNAKLYPNQNGQQQPALMEVWHKAGDYWRSGLRLGDVLPEQAPACKITRLEDGGWIALFPKDKHLLSDNEPLMNVTEGAAAPANHDDRNLDRGTELSAAQPTLSTQQRQPRAVSKRRNRRQKQNDNYPTLQFDTESEPVIDSATCRRILAGVGAAAVTLVMIHFFGLLGPALIGLLAGGLLKG